MKYIIEDTKAPPAPLKPLMQDDEIEYLIKCFKSLPYDATIVEWGSGGSTVFWLEHIQPKQKIISIEHNKEWADRVSTALKEHPKGEQVSYFYVKPHLPIDFYGYARPNEENPAGLSDYIHLSGSVPEMWNADFFFIDGIARGACAAAVFGKSTCKNPFVFIHDYDKRELWYDWAVNIYSKKERHGFTLVQLFK